MQVYRLHERSRHSDDAAGLGQCGSARFATLSCFAHIGLRPFSAFAPVDHGSFLSLIR